MSPTPVRRSVVGIAGLALLATAGTLTIVSAGAGVLAASSSASLPTTVARGSVWGSAPIVVPGAAQPQAHATFDQHPTRHFVTQVSRDVAVLASDQPPVVLLGPAAPLPPLALPPLVLPRLTLPSLRGSKVGATSWKVRIGAGASLDVLAPAHRGKAAAQRPQLDSHAVRAEVRAAKVERKAAKAERKAAKADRHATKRAHHGRKGGPCAKPHRGCE